MNCSSAKPLDAEPKRKDSMIPLADKMIAETTEEVETGDLNVSPFEIVDKALETFGNDVAISFWYRLHVQICP